MEILKGAPTESSLVLLKEIAKADPKEWKTGYRMVS
jgi:hypothetical protein